MTKKNNETRLIYAAVIIVITVLSVIVIVTGIAARRNGDDPAPPVDTVTSPVAPSTEKADKTPDTSGRNDSSARPDETLRAPDESKKPDDTKDVFAGDDTSAEDVMATPTLPEFVSPARGNVAKAHSETVLVYSLTMDDYRTHTGIDIEGKPGDVVVAAADGVIRSVYEDPMWGYCISIAHEGDTVSYYMNLSGDSMDGVVAGDSVKAGDIIGAIGESALFEVADEPHLHFELKVDGVYVDPEEYFEVPAGNSYE